MVYQRVIIIIMLLLATDKRRDLCEISGLVHESDASQTIRFLSLCPAVVDRLESVELVMQLLGQVAFTAGNLLQRPVDVIAQPLQLASRVFHTRIDGVRVVVQLIDVLSPVLHGRLRGVSGRTVMVFTAHPHCSQCKRCNSHGISVCLSVRLCVCPSVPVFCPDE